MRVSKQGKTSFCLVSTKFDSQEREIVEIDEISELKLDRLLRRGVEGELSKNSSMSGGGMFSLFALGSYSSVPHSLFTRFFRGDDSGVRSIEDGLLALEEVREREGRAVRLPRREGVVCERVRGRVGDELSIVSTSSRS